MTDAYAAFCATKLTHAAPIGMPNPPELSPKLFPFQRDLVRIALQRGRCALFEDTGLGKTIQELAWARDVADFTGKPVLILTPFAVAGQMVAMSTDYGIPATRAYSQSDVCDLPTIYVTNYDRLHLFDASVFGGVVADESAILKDYTSATRNAMTAAFAATPFRLSASATPAPNDWTELGCHAEFLGIRTREEMLAEFFVHDGGSTQDWRLKGHAVEPFWRWVATWALVVRKPSDLGYENGGFDLPPLHMHEHIVELGTEHAFAAGQLFVTGAATLSEQRAVRRSSMADRVALAASIVAQEPNEQWLVWGELNDECDMATKALPGAIQVAGKDADDEKERQLLGFAAGQVRTLVTKGSIASAGLNFQSCARMIFLGASYSYEKVYQSIRRCFRFGQKREVHVHFIATDADRAILDALKRKERDAQALNDEASKYMLALTREAVAATHNEREEYVATVPMRLPEWLVSEELEAA